MGESAHPILQYSKHRWRVCNPHTIFYGSLHKDSDDHFWYFGRHTVNTSNEYSTPAVMRNPHALSVDNWDTTQVKLLAPSKVGKTSTAHWGFSLSNKRMISIWAPPFQVGPEMPNDRPDDLQPGICMDKNGNIHVVCVPLVGDPNNHPNTDRNLDHYRISPPYTSSNVVLVDNGLLRKDQDVISIQVMNDKRPGMESVLYCTFISFDGSGTSSSSLYLTRFNGSTWEGTQTLLLASTKGGWRDQSNGNVDDMDSGLVVVQTDRTPSDVRIVNFRDFRFPLKP